MELIDGYTLTSTNSSAKQSGGVTVRDSAGVVVARVRYDGARVLNRIRTVYACKERQALIVQLQRAGVPNITVERIICKPGA
jgi:hypothetical protein